MRIEIDRDQLNDVLQLAASIGEDTPKLISRALNKTAARAKVVSAKKIQQQVNLKSAYIKSKLTVHKATYGNLSAQLSAEKRGVLMTQYPYKILKNGSGASVKIKRGGATKKLPGAFKVNLKAGENRVEALVYLDPRGGTYSTGHAKFIVLYSPSVSQVFDSVRDDVDEEMADYLITATDAELSAILRGY